AEKNRVGQSLLAAAIELGRDDIISIDKPVKRAVLRPGTTLSARAGRRRTCGVHVPGTANALPQAAATPRAGRVWIKPHA
ncbi:MAG: hypothetical protein LBE06_05720, partial [Azoarcus sp.]|nr:hypothetical protein [Azoarcus sp.]